MRRSYAAIIALLVAVSSPIYSITADTIRSMRLNTSRMYEAYADVSLACPNIELPSITGSKSSFRYIDAGCETSLTIRPSYGVSGGRITGYNVYSIPYAPPFPFDMGNKIFIDQDDIWGDVIQLPFNFCFFDNTYNQAVVGANGLVSFNTSVANQYSAWSLEYCENIPSTTFKGSGGRNWSNAIYGVFEDIDPRKIGEQHSNGSIRYGVLGAYPCRTLTISWNKVPNFSCANGSKYWDSFQIVLYEGTNVIDVYVNHKSRCSTWNLGRGIIGVQNLNCTQAVAAPNRNTTNNWTADREAWRFAPVSTPQYTITYYEGMGTNGRILGYGDQVTIDPRTTESITARLQFTAANGDVFDLLDTAVIVHKEVEPIVTEKTICHNGSYYWRGKTYTQPGTYRDEVGGYEGCYDKVYELRLTIDNTVGQKEYRTICEGEACPWKGKNYTTEGTYYNTSRTADNCTVTDTLVLKVHKKYHFSERDTVCQGENYTWHGHTYTQQGVYDDTHLTKDGCDSTYTLNLIVGEKYIFQTNKIICEGQSFKWRGKTYKQEGTYYDSLISSLGCDSVYCLKLEIAPNYKIDEYDTICQGENYTWHGNTYTVAGTYYDHLNSIYGCDSTHILHLHVNKSYLFIEENGIRADGRYRWRNRILTAPGQYYDSLKTVDGCDSVYQLNLSYIRSQLYTYTHYICEGESYQWRRKIYTQEGVYSDSLKNVNGADSVYQLHLYVGVPVYSEENASICDGETYLWRGKTYTQSGTYYDTVPETENSCDEYYQLHLTVGNNYHFIEDAKLCEGEKFSWRGYEYTRPGIYYDEFITALGCDSVYQLNLKGCKKYYYPSHKTICKGERYTWRGKTYTDSGVYWDSLKTVDQCDSVYRLELRVEEPVTIEEQGSICDNEIFYWRNKSYTATGIYYDSLLTQNGCDSVYILDLTVNPTVKEEEYATICEGDSYPWRGNTYRETDSYYDFFTTEKGCDSAYVLHLTVLPTYFHKDKDYICGGENYVWQGEIYTEAGTYTKTLQATIGGCDSIVELTLGVADNYYFEEEYSTCEGSVYSWHNREIKETGVYWDSLLSVYGCDSIYKLTITFNPTYHFVTRDTICQGQTYPWRDSLYAIEGVYYDQLATIHECDSLYELRLTVLPVYHVYDTIVFCHGESVEWNQLVLTEEGTYIDSLLTQSNCDSIIELTLIEKPVYDIHVYDTINEGQSYSWQGSVYTETGLYHNQLKTIDGCDSILSLHLTVHPRYSFITQDTICEGESYLWQGNIYTQTGEYSVTYTTIHGNDSAYHLVLTVNPTYEINDKIYLCTNSVYTWHGREIVAQGIYFDSLKTSSGCDSIYSLEVTESDSYKFDIYDTICTNETYSFHGNTYTEAGLYPVTYITAYGCDSTYQLHLFQRIIPIPQFPVTDVCADEEWVLLCCTPSVEEPIYYTIQFDERSLQNGFADYAGQLSDSIIRIPLPQDDAKAYVEPNVYGGTITLSSETCKEQHVYDLAFNILYPASVVTQKFNDVLAVLNDKYNGGYSFSHFQWYADGSPIYGAELPYYYGNGSLEASYYQVLLTRQSDGVAMYTCPIIPTAVQQVESPGVETYISPSIVDKHNPYITIYSPDFTYLTIYNMHAQAISRYAIHGMQTTIEMPTQEGVYILLVSDKKSDSKRFKVLVK